MICLLEGIIVYIWVKSDVSLFVTYNWALSSIFMITNVSHRWFIEYQGKCEQTQKAEDTSFLCSSGMTTEN